MSPFLLVELVPGVWMERIVGNRGGTSKILLAGWRIYGEKEGSWGKLEERSSSSSKLVPYFLP